MGRQCEHSPAFCDPPNRYYINSCMSQQQPAITTCGNLDDDLRKKIECYSYRLGDRIGQGYSSVVYRGHHDETSTQHYNSRGARGGEGGGPAITQGRNCSRSASL